MGATDRILKLRGHKSLHDCYALGTRRRDNAGFLVFRQPIFGQQRSDLISSEQVLFSVLTAHGNPHAVAVGIGCHHHVGVFFFGQRDRQRQRLGIFWIG